MFSFIYWKKTKRMKIVLSGVETNNKGAELMLYAILQEIERKFPNATVYFDMGSISQGLSYIQTNLRLKDKPVETLWRWYHRLHIPGILRRLHIREHTGWHEDKYAVPFAKYFIDGSGFHFSDKWHWSEALTRRKKMLWRSHHRWGSRMIFLPQAFGPFHETYSQQHFANMARYADVIMPREQMSYNYIKESGLADINKVVVFTDFTSLVYGVFPEGYEHLKGAVCVIPNMRMIDQGSISFDNYIQLLTDIIRRVEAGGRSVYLLNHEGRGDEELAYKCKAEVGEHLEVVTGLNALQVKGLISTAYLVITSRFHGVASALNSCVPCLATSWSHKYEALFNDYGQHDCILPLDDDVKCMTMIEELLQTDMNSEIRSQLSERVPLIKEETRRMWEYVWSI